MARRVVDSSDLVGMDGYQTFGSQLRDLLIERGITTQIGNPNWSEFSRQVSGIEYETLRKAVTGERRATAHLIEAVAAALKIEPELFVEYQLLEARRQFDPREVGVQAALDNLRRWTETQKRRRR